MRFFVFQDGQAGGPHSMEALRQMASIFVLTKATLVAREGDSEWTPAGEIPELVDLFPPPPVFQQSTKPIENINAASSKPPISVDDILKQNLTQQLSHERPMVFPKRPNRRLREYVILTVVGNVFGFSLFFILPTHPLVVVSLIGAITLCNAALYWLLFQVMERY